MIRKEKKYGLHLRNTEFKTYYSIKNGLFKKNQYVKAVDNITLKIKKDKHLV